MNRQLPVLAFGPFRKHPTRIEQQRYEDPREVCQNCTSGVCCSSEDPVYLTSFDIFRLAAFFDMSPAGFMLTFTQEAFDDPDGDPLRRSLIDSPEWSIVTYLRRRENSPKSPCIFLKYTRDPDGLHRRICSIHDARPLACREFYAHHCRNRVTGELASLLSEGFEKLRDGEITEKMVDVGLAKFGHHDPSTTTLSQNLEYFFWIEMKRAIHMDQANTEGANNYSMASYQDSIDVKLNRVISSKHLRFEEKYGERPRDEQLQPYTSGLRFCATADYKRIMALVASSSSGGLHSTGNFPFYIGSRLAFHAATRPSVSSSIPEKELTSFLDSLPDVKPFCRHDLQQVRSITLRDIYAAVLKGYNYLLLFADYVITMGEVLEDCEPAFIESELLLMIAGFETSLHPFIAKNPYFQPVKTYVAGVVIDFLEKKVAQPISFTDLLDVLRFLQQVDGTVASLPADLRGRFKCASSSAEAKLECRESEFPIAFENPVASRHERGKHLRVRCAWREWFDQVRNLRLASEAGLIKGTVGTFYQESVSQLEKIPLRKGYILDLYDMVCALASSMSLNETIPYRRMPYKDAARRLAEYSIRLFNWMEAVGGVTGDCEISAGFLCPVYKGLGVSYDHDPSFGVIVRRLLDSQLPDGSWQSDPPASKLPDSQGEYLCSLYRVTWACVDALRPLRNDLFISVRAE